MPFDLCSLVENGYICRSKTINSIYISEIFRITYLKYGDGHLKRYSPTFNIIDQIINQTCCDDDDSIANDHDSPFNYVHTWVNVLNLLMQRKVVVAGQEQ